MVRYRSPRIITLLAIVVLLSKLYPSHLARVHWQYTV